MYWLLDNGIISHIVNVKFKDNAKRIDITLTLNPVSLNDIELFETVEVSYVELKHRFQYYMSHNYNVIGKKILYDLTHVTVFSEYDNVLYDDTHRSPYSLTSHFENKTI